MKCIVHIGVEKTGSSSIQKFLSINQLVLSERGYLVPNSLGAENHVALCAMAQDAVPRFKTIDAILGFQSDEDRSTFVRQARDDFEKEIRTAPSHIHTALLSNEHLHSNLIERSEIQRLCDILKAQFDEVNLIVYLRRQDRLAISQFSARIKGGETIEGTELFMKIGNPLPHYYDFLSLIRSYAEVFGRDKIAIGLFEGRRMAGGDIVADYCEKIGIQLTNDFIVPPRSNPSIDWGALTLLSLVNPHIPPMINGVWNRRRNWLVEILEDNYPSRAPIGPREDAMEFYSFFRADNETLRREFLPDIQPPLFEEDFSNYLTRDEITPPKLDEIGEIFARLWNERAGIHIRERDAKRPSGTSQS